MLRYRILFALAAASFLIIAGCQKHQHAQGDAQTHDHASNEPATTPSKGEPSAEDEIREARAGLSPEDRKLVEAQEWCVIQTDERLGSMGPPIKLMVNGQPVFVCCGSCKRKAMANPDKTLATLEELKAKVKKDGVKP
jgi:hypothetical protein